MRKSGADFGSGQWFTILQAAGNLESRKETPFTAAMLSKQAKMQSTTRTVKGEDGEPKEEVVSSAHQQAAAWLLKFEKWGYVERAGVTKGEGPRPAILWKMTEKGKACKLQERLEVRFERLLLAVLKCRKERGQKGESKSWKALCEVTDEVNVDQIYLDENDEAKRGGK